MAEWQWEHEPTAEEATASLDTLGAQHGISPHKYVAHVVAIPQNEKILDENGRAVGGYKRVWKLYMTVAGRISMLWDAAEVNKWQVQFVPDESGDAAHGLISTDPMVYRESLVIHDAEGTLRYSVLGVSQLKGGDYAWEKAETAARGRAIAALGIGVLPGSGVSSAEEITEVVRGPGRATDEASDGLPTTKDELLQLFNERREQLRQAKDMTLNDANAGLTEYVSKHYGKTLTAVDLGDGDVSSDWGELTAGELGLLIRQTEKALRQLKSDATV